MEFMSATPPECVTAATEEVISVFVRMIQLFNCTIIFQVMCGVLRNGRGTKVLVYLLDTALVVGRQVSRPGIGKVCLKCDPTAILQRLLCSGDPSVPRPRARGQPRVSRPH